MQDSIAWYGRTRQRGLGVCFLCANSCLGSGESGKSTIVKQMKIIHQNGYTVDELAMYRLTIYKNLVDCAKALVLAIQKFDLEPDVLINRVCYDESMQYFLLLYW